MNVLQGAVLRRRILGRSTHDRAVATRVARARYGNVGEKHAPPESPREQTDAATDTRGRRREQRSAARAEEPASSPCHERRLKQWARAHT